MHTLAIPGANLIIAYMCIVLDVAWEGDNCAGLIAEISDMEVALSPNGGLLVDGQHIPESAIKTEQVSVLTSKIAQIEQIRKFSESLLKKAISGYEGSFLLIDGRDPNPEELYDLPVCTTIYLDVTDAEAARRTGESIDEVRARNARDSQRLQAAMHKADYILDTTRISPEDGVRKVALHIIHCVSK